jgi:MOSC domain-containing protein YiiM
MKVVSINTAVPEKLQVGKKSVKTGIFKRPRKGSVSINELGLSGDTIVNKKFHSGVDQAIYLYSAKDYGWWQRRPSAFECHSALDSGVNVAGFRASCLA